MKLRLLVVFGMVLGPLTAVNSFGGPGESPGAGGTRVQQMGRPLAEMMLYEAAEQAVEDDYSQVIPEPETVSTEEDATETVGDVTPVLPEPTSVEEQLVEE